MKLPVKKIWTNIKPFVIAIAVLVVLRYTGLMSGLTYYANTALVKTGMMDIRPEKDLAAKDFDYDFHLRDLKDNNLDVNALKGKVIFLNLWATWCGPCRAEMPSIQELYDSIGHEKVAFVMLSLDNPEHQNKIERFIADKKFTFPVYQPASALPKLLQVSSIPATFVIGVDGKVKLKKVGTANYSTEGFRKFLRELTEEKAPAPTN